MVFLKTCGYTIKEDIFQTNCNAIQLKFNIKNIYLNRVAVKFARVNIITRRNKLHDQTILHKDIYSRVELFIIFL